MAATRKNSYMESRPSPKRIFQPSFAKCRRVSEFHALESRRFVLEEWLQGFRESEVLLAKSGIRLLIRLRQCVTRYAAWCDRQMSTVRIECDGFNSFARFVTELIELEIAAYCCADRGGDMSESGKVVVFGDRSWRGHTASHVRGLETHDVHPRSCEISRAHQAIVTGANDDCVRTLNHR